MQLIIATKNDSKIKEITQILDADIDFKTYKDFADWPEVKETGTTFKENALLKAKMLADKYNIAAVADDSGLTVDALGGEPGIHSSRYAGRETTDEKNITKLLTKMKGIKNRRASFVTVVAYYHPSGQNLFTEGEIKGEIITEPRGTGGFGYDPVFLPAGYNKTFAEMSASEKNQLSHRGQAFRKLKELLVGSA